MTLSPNGIHLSAAEKRIWATLAPLPYQVVRHPCPYTLLQLGIEECFNELCEEGQLSGLLLTQGNPSYQRLTLEFLSTLRVNKTRQAVTSIAFQMRNRRYEMPMAQFKEIFGFTGEVTKMPNEFSHCTDRFWQEITDERKFSANRAKGSSIRNPVLRVLQKACVCYPFARVEHGSVTRDELFLLWQILYKQPPLNLGYFMIKHLERATKKKRGTLCVGAVVSTIALHLGVQLGDLVADIGDHNTSAIMLIDITFLKRTFVIAEDRRNHRLYLKQKAGDHFPLPDSDNTYVNGPEQRENWLMNSSVHRRITSRNPGNVSPSSSEQEDEEEDEEEEEENEETPTQQRQDEAGPSTSRRRNRGDRHEEDVSMINTRLDSMELNMRQLREDNDAQWAQLHQQNNDQWANISAQFGNFYTQFDQRWTTLEQQQQDFMATWRPPQCPPDQ